MSSTIRMLVAVVGVLLAGVPSHAAGRIEWRLENPFRLFKNPKDTAMHAEAFQALGPLERARPILAAERRLEARFAGRGWAEKVFNNTCYDQDRDRHSACQDYIVPRSHRVVVWLVRQPDFWDFLNPSPAGEVCHWRLADASGKLIGEARAPCGQRVTLDVPWPRGGRLTVSTPSGAAAVPAIITVRDVLIVGLGDSFAAGEGNPDAPVRYDDTRDLDYGTVEIAGTGRLERLDGYPAREGGWGDIDSGDFQRERARWLDRECHRSLYSHQLRAALQLAIERPRRAITFVGLACSGAEIVNGLLLPKPVRECTPGDHFASPAQLSQLSEELCETARRGAPMPAALMERMPELRPIPEDERRITRCETGTGGAGLKRPVDLLLLSIGGNDIGFTPIVSDSILGEESIYRRLGARTGDVYGVEGARERAKLVRERFQGLRVALEQFFAVRANGGGQAPVLITGYPHMGYGEDGLNACGGSKGLEVFPPFQLNAIKVDRAEEFTEQLNTGLKAVAGMGWTYVNGFRADFRQHGLCAVNGGADEMIGFPRRRDGVWAPFKPSAYKPYTPRQRWFRTPNDAFLATNMHADQFSSFGANCSGLYSGAFKLLARKHWKPFQVFLASTHGGAFHPTAEGQARIADEVAATARAIIDRGP